MAKAIQRPSLLIMPDRGACVDWSRFLSDLAEGLRLSVFLAGRAVNKDGRRGSPDELIGHTPQ